MIEAIQTNKNESYIRSKRLILNELYTGCSTTDVKKI